MKQTTKDIIVLVSILALPVFLGLVLSNGSVDTKTVSKGVSVICKDMCK